MTQEMLIKQAKEIRSLNEIIKDHQDFADYMFKECKELGVDGFDTLVKKYKKLSKELENKRNYIKDGIAYIGDCSCGGKAIFETGNGMQCIECLIKSKLTLLTESSNKEKRGKE